MHPFKALSHGSKTYWIGVRWLKRHPIFILLLLIPSFLGLLGMVGAGTLFVKYHSDLLKFFLFEPGPEWWWTVLYFLAGLLFHVTALVAILLIGVALTNIIAAPLYEQISEAIEKDLFPGNSVGLSFWQSFRLVPEEIKKMVLITAISIVLFLIPGLNLLALFSSAFLVSWDFYDYPLARRGLRLGARIKHARQDFWVILGMSFWFLIPLVQIVLVPMAVVGGTILGLQKLAGQRDTQKSI
ncbi:MAG: EI24 domain-containing protein [Bdellovibrionota bacterium]|nr:MAG: hypothetical protein EOP10_22180 [Pseudomonadota bacterium]